MKLQFYNDTGRVVDIHPATLANGCDVDEQPIQPGTIRTFTLPNGSTPWVKLWDYGDQGLQIFIAAMNEV
jgi:hypothetical protein